jgi:hypothetical protein
VAVSQAIRPAAQPTNTPRSLSQLTNTPRTATVCGREKVRSRGSNVVGQIFARAQGLLLGLDGVIQPLSVRSATYLAMRMRPLEERVAVRRPLRPFWRPF